MVSYDPKTVEVTFGMICNSRCDGLICCRPVGHDGSHRSEDGAYWSDITVCRQCKCSPCQCGELNTVANLPAASRKELLDAFSRALQAKLQANPITVVTEHEGGADEGMRKRTYTYPTRAPGWVQPQ